MLMDASSSGGPREPPGDVGGEGKSSERGLGVAPLSAGRVGGGGGQRAPLGVEDGRLALP